MGPLVSVIQRVGTCLRPDAALGPKTGPWRNEPADGTHAQTTQETPHPQTHTPTTTQDTPPRAMAERVVVDFSPGAWYSGTYGPDEPDHRKKNVVAACLPGSRKSVAIRVRIANKIRRGLVSKF